MIQLDTRTPLWGEFAEIEAVRLDNPAAVARLVGALVNLSFGARVTELTALATEIKGPLLYVGSRHEAIPRGFEAAGLPVAILDPHNKRRESASLALTALEATGPFRLVVMPMLAFGAWAERFDPDLLITQIGSYLAADGAIIVDHAIPFTPGATAEVVDVRFALNDSTAAGRIGCRTDALPAANEPASYLINGWWIDGVPGSSCAAALLINKEIESTFERALVASGLILVESGTAGVGPTRLATYKRRVASPLCYPFSPLSLSSTPEKVLILKTGHGCRVHDTNGKEYIDACSGLWNTHIGLGNREVIDAISVQLHRLSYATLFAERGNEPARELAEVLVSIAPYPLQWVCYTGSGSESTELGIRIALLYAQLCGRNDARQIAHLDESYHGTFGTSASVSGLVPAKELFQSHSIAVSIPTPNPARCPSGESYLDFALRCADALEEKAKAGDIAAFIFEPVLASAGVIVPPVQYFERIQSICARHDILLIADEAATGFGRTGRWFASEHFGLRPDILLMAKGINSGYLPFGAVMFSAAIGEKFLRFNLPLLHGSTYNGHPACCASALANIAILKRERLIERSMQMGHYLRQALEGLRALDAVADVRGLGLIQAVVLKQTNGIPADPLQALNVCKEIQKRGVLTYPMPGAIGLCPALTTTREDIGRVVKSVRAVLSTVRLENGAVHWIESAAPVAQSG